MNDQKLAPPTLPKITWWIIWGALLNAIIVYVVVLQVSPPEPSEEKSWLMIRNILLGVAVVSIVISFGVRLFVTKRLAEKGEPATLQKAFASYIVSLALSESAAIFGMVIAFLGAPLAEYLAFLVIGGLALIAQPPTFLPPSNAQ